MQKMVLLISVLLLLLSSVSLHNTAQAVAEICRGTHCYGGETSDPRPCTGAHCPGGRSSRPPRQFNPTAQHGRAVNAHAAGGQHHAYPSASRAASEAYPAVQTPRGRHSGGDSGISSSSSSGGGTRTRAPEVLPAGCTDADCAALVKQFQPTTNDTRDCKGIECRLPLRVRPKARAKSSCVGDGCLDASEESVSTASQLPPPVHLSDRAAQFLGDFPEFGYPSPELGGAPLGVQLTCDIKPGLLSSSSVSSQIFNSCLYRLIYPPKCHLLHAGAGNTHRAQLRTGLTARTLLTSDPRLPPVVSTRGLWSESKGRLC